MRKLLLPLLFLGIIGTTNAQILNSSFENWSTDTWESPDYAESAAGDYPHPVSKSSDKYQGNYAIKMQNYINKDNSLSPSYLVFGTWNDVGPQSGYPYTQKPSTVTGYYKAALQANDSAIVGAVFFKSGVVIDQEFFYLTTSQSNFTAFSFNLTSLNSTPDSALIVLTSANAFGSGNISSNGWVIYDYIQFGGAGITQQIPNTDFEQWTNHVDETPGNWHTDNSNLMEEGKPANAVKTTDAYRGQFALQLTTDFRTNSKNNTIDFKNSVRNFEYTQTYKTGGSAYEGSLIDTLIGYYKYFPAAGGDTGNVYAEFYKHGYGVVNSGLGSYIELTATSNYKVFKMPLLFGSTLPDTVFIDISSSNWPINMANVGSKLIIDDLHFASHPLGVNNLNKNIFGINVYPNPVVDFAALEFELPVSTLLYLNIYDVNGKLVFAGNANQYLAGKNKLTINTQELSKGLYYYQLSNNDRTVMFNDTFIVK